jgi:hydrogenase/urease accessory protein HupE
MNRRAFFKRTAGAVAAAALAPGAMKAVAAPPAYSHIEYGLGFEVTEAMLEDDRLAPFFAEHVAHYWHYNPMRQSFTRPFNGPRMFKTPSHWTSARWRY